MRIFQALHDSKELPTIIFRGEKEARRLNDLGYGIFGTVNEFNSVRRESDLIKLNFWYCEIDGGKKEKQIEAVKDFFLPTLIVESKNGYHCYWRIKEDLIKKYGLENALLVYKEINKRIVKKIGADKIIDAARILRVPGFYHCKNPDDKFLVKTVLKSGISYMPLEMLMLLPEAETENKEKKQFSINTSGDSFWERANSIDCMDGLKKLSGSDYVNGEEFDFIVDRNKYQISVNGKRANCWIDENGKIGSSAGAGPTIVNWLSYYNHDMKKIAEIIKEFFPECVDIKETVELDFYG